VRHRTGGTGLLRLQPPVVGTVIVYTDGHFSVLLSRKKDWELWCYVFQGKRVLARSNAKLEISDGNFIDGLPLRFEYDKSAKEIMDALWPARPGKTITLKGRLLHKTKSTRFVERLEMGKFRRSTTLGNYAVEALALRISYAYEADTIFSKRITYTGYYVPAWRISIFHKQEGLWSSGETARIDMALKRLYVPGIVGKPIPIPAQCLKLMA